MTAWPQEKTTRRTARSNRLPPTAVDLIAAMRRGWKVMMGPVEARTLYTRDPAVRVQHHLKHEGDFGGPVQARTLLRLEEEGLLEARTNTTGTDTYESHVLGQG